MSANDGPSGVNTVQLQNGTGGNWIQMDLYAGNSTDGNYSTTINTTMLPDGWTNFTINATDYANNFNDTEYITVYIDNSPPTITLVGPADNSYNNTGVLSVTFEPNDTGASAVGDDIYCEVRVQNSTGGVFVNASVVTPGVQYTKTFNLPQDTYTWTIYCNDEEDNSSSLYTVSSARTYIVDTQPVNITNIDTTPDFFVCVRPADGYTSNSNITFVVTAADIGPAGIDWVKANISEINASAPLVNLVNTGGNTWEATITVNDTSNDSFRNVNVTFMAQDKAGNTHILWNSVDPWATVVLYNMTTPPLQDPNCEQAGPSTTNFCNELNFSDINFVMEVQRNGSASCNNGMALPWGNNMKTVIKLNFTSLNFSDPSIGEKLQRLGEAIQPHITPPNEFGDSWIFVNTTAFEELNTSTTITMYGLPFASQPEIVGPDPSVNITNWTENAPYNISGIIVPNSDLTFVVGHFSQYNVTDDVPPTIEITSPLNGSVLATTTPVVNVTVNGTGTKLSNITVYVDGNVLFSYNDTQIQQNCFNHSADWEEVHCNATTSSLQGGSHTITVLAFDFGGEAPGNNATNQSQFEVDLTKPTVTLNSLANDSWTNDTTPPLQFTAVDNQDTNMTCTARLYNSSLIESKTVYASNNTATAFTFATTLSDGTYYWNISCDDNAGNTGDSATWILHVDTTSPSLIVYTQNNSNFTDGNVQILINVTDNMDTAMVCKVYEGANAKSTDHSASNNTNTTITTYELSDGTHNLLVKCLDEAGNSDSTALTVNVAQTPAPTLVSPANGSSTTDRTPTLKFGVTDNDATVNCTLYVDNSAVWNSSVTSGTTKEVTLDTQTLGTHEWYVSCKDAGNHTGNSSKWIFKITSVSTGGGISSSGGTGGTAEPPAPSSEINLDTEKEEAFDLMSGYEAKFSIGGSSHRLRIDHIVGNKVTIIIYSEPIVIEVAEGETKEVDLDGDGVNDIAVTVVEIYNAIKAKVKIEAIVPEQPPEEQPSQPSEEQPPAEKPPTEQPPAEEQPQPEQPSQLPAEKPPVSKEIIYGIVGILVLVILAGLYFKMKK